MDKTLLAYPPFSALLLFNLLVFGIAGYYFETGLPPAVMTLAGALTGLLITMAFYMLFQFLGRIFQRIPQAMIVAVFSALASLILLRAYAFRLPAPVFYPAIFLGMTASLVAYYSVRRLQLNRGALPAWGGILLSLMIVIAGMTWLGRSGGDPYRDSLPAPFGASSIETLSTRGIPNPAAAGPYSYELFTYGSGTDKVREEFGKAVRFRTPTVDARQLLPDWKGKKKRWREHYWGFGADRFPLNARVYCPEGEGPFPLVLIVHGNHSMIDHSDGGYAYLGEMLAGRGMITASVDENFINAHWSGDFRGKEMPVRAWLLLKHLELWRQWNEDAAHPLFQQIDLDNILLIGHSRGGEAVSIAAAFNELEYFPDDAGISFDFDFSIKGVVAIAPTDYRYHRQIRLKNINFLSLQGSYDADETSFWGLRPYRRLQFTDAGDWFKAGVYVHRANHGQFNSSWGRSDFGGPMQWLLNRGALISGADQREAAKVFISAFAEAVLKQNRQYLPVFKNVALARDWLPENFYLTHYSDNKFTPLIDFEEDMDLSSGGQVAEIQTHNLKIWREEKLGTRGEGSQENNAVVIGWDYGEIVDRDSVASYRILLADSLALPVDSSGSFLVTLAAGDPKELKRKDKSMDKTKDPLLDLTIRLVDKRERTADIPVSKIKRIAPRLKTHFTKLASINKTFGKDWEIQPETFHLPLAEFDKSEGTFDFAQIRRIDFILDQVPFGILVIDDIGFAAAGNETWK